MLGPQRSGGALEPDCAVSPVRRYLAPDGGLRAFSSLHCTWELSYPQKKVLPGVRESSVWDQTFKGGHLSSFVWE